MAEPTADHRLTLRNGTIQGLRALADFLQDNPEVPVREQGGEYMLFVRDRSDDEARAEVDRIAGLLGVAVQDDTERGGHYTATRSFGRVAYHVVHIPDRARREHAARMSYLTNITLEPDGTRTGQEHQARFASAVA